MANITFNLTGSHINRLVTAICGLQDYDRESEETKETKQQFTKRKIREWLVGQTRRWERAEANKAAAASLTDIEVAE